MYSLQARIDPRRSLAAAIAWEVTAIALLAATLASVWFATAARHSAEQQIGATFRQYATQISNEIDINLFGKLQSLQSIRAATSFFTGVGVAGAAERASGLFPKMRSEMPEMRWIVFAGPDGRVLAAAGAGITPGAEVSAQRWFTEGGRAPWMGDVHDNSVVSALLAAAPDRRERPAGDDTYARLVELSVPVRDAKGKLLGVLGAQLGLDWIQSLESGLTASLRSQQSVDTLVVARDGLVLVGPPRLLGQRLQGAAQAASRDALAEVTRSLADGTLPAPERTSGQLVAGWQDGPEYLMGFAVTDGAGGFPGGIGWTVWVREPVLSAFAPVREQWRQNLLIITLLALLTIAGGVLLAQRLTRRLAAIASSADDIRTGRAGALEVPAGSDEAARIGLSLKKLLDELETRNQALAQLNAELDARVAARTREVERLGEENRRAAMVRERLRFARDLHDTLAHSIMELLAQIRLMRKLQQTAPARLQDELALAEAAALEGLRTARGAIAELRHDVVRDLGLDAALRQLLSRLEARTGLAIAYRADPQLADMAGTRAENLYRIADEALGNIERHAGAGRVSLTLETLPAGAGAASALKFTIEDDGKGFDTSMSEQPGHYGLRGLRELAQLMDAELSIRSEAGAGTCVCVTMGL